MKIFLDQFQYLLLQKGKVQNPTQNDMSAVKKRAKRNIIFSYESDENGRQNRLKEKNKK